MGMHPPKVETFDVAAGTNTDPKGIVRAVDTYEVHPWGLYMARASDHKQFCYLESWLLPRLGLRATIFHFTPGNERDQDRYVDIGEYTHQGQLWHGTDHYLDLVVQTGRGTTLLDTDELLAARAANLLDAPTTERAVHRTMTAVDGIAAHGHDLDAWLRSEGMPVTWR
jgi:predicted RNA-binding protein associated with RNAse of E/G family